MDDQNDKDVNVQDKLKKNNKSFELIFYGVRQEKAFHQPYRNKNVLNVKNHKIEKPIIVWEQLV